MSENISSDVLFHFTKSLDYVKDILKNGFSPHYCLEYSLERGDREAASKGLAPTHAVPMVCFCDLPLSLIRKHLKEYGSFGIGLDKKWRLRNGVAPVTYTHAKAQTRQPVLRLIAKAVRSGDKTSEIDLKLLAAYTKRFRGPAWRDDQIKRGKHFYNEREWRYVPAIRQAGLLFLKRKDYDDTSKKDKLHDRWRKRYALPISPRNIMYLIMPYEKDENNVLELHRYIMRLYGRRYGRRDAILVTTTIMTDDCIKHDT